MILEGKQFNSKPDIDLFLLISEDDALDRLHKILCLQQLMGLKTPATQLLKKIKFCGFELQSQSDPSSSPFEKFSALNDFFFQQKKYNLTHPNLSLASEDLFIDDVIHNKKGHPLAVSLLYISLAAFLNLNIQFVKSSQFSILKFIHEGKSIFIDLRNHGSLLNDSQVLDILNKLCLESDTITPDYLECMSFKEIMIAYLNCFEIIFEDEFKSQSLLNLYDMMLVLHSSHLSSLSKRALMYLEMGKRKEAHADLKRYFLLCDPDKKPPELLRIFEVLSMELEKPIVV